jgi:hypothetical protein
MVKRRDKIQRPPRQQDTGSAHIIHQYHDFPLQMAKTRQPTNGFKRRPLTEEDEKTLTEAKLAYESHKYPS